LAECAKFSDKHIDGALAKINDGKAALKVKYPTMYEPTISSGLRGTRYFIEFPLTGKNIDAMALFIST